LIGFLKIKPRHPDGLKKTHIWVEKTAMGALAVDSNNPPELPSLK